MCTAAKAHKAVLDKRTLSMLTTSTSTAGVDESILNVMVEQVKMLVYFSSFSHGLHCKAGCYSTNFRIK